MADKKLRKVLQDEPVKAGEEPKRIKFVVRQGRVFGQDRKRQGTEVELTVAEASAFADKLEPVDRGYVLPTAATPEELAEAGIVQVNNPSPASTDRKDMTPEQRAETSQTNFETGVGPEPTAGGNLSDAGGRSPRGAEKPEKVEPKKKG